MTEQQTSYRQIFKATSLFGGVQVFNIIISVIRSKFIALLLGPTGMGISGLLTSTSGFITALTNFGLGTSAVKDVASASSTNDEVRISTVVTVLRRLVWVTGLLGMILTSVLSPWLSEITFGNRDYTLAFIWISVTLLFQQLSSGQLVLLQGLRKLNYLAKANMAGALIGLLISVPIYFKWRIDGIVPVIILSSFSGTALSWYFARKTKIKSLKISGRRTIEEGKAMLKMGFILSMSGLISLGGSYIIRIYISNTGGVEQVGLYSAGFAIITTYVGMVFTAMSTDYYPRLSSIANDNIRATDLINQQAEVAILILAPILSVFLIFINWVVVILYSQKFVGVNEMIHWAALGMYFKAASWSIGFILLAKGATKIFFWNELIGNFYLLGFNIAGYRVAGLEGLGMSFLASYFVYSIQIFLLVKFKYSFSFNKEFCKIASIQFLLGFMCFLVTKILVTPWVFIVGFLIILISTIYSIHKLNQKTGLKSILISKFFFNEK
jgi:O-antigen/teichoic acid export membrane protein